MIQHLYILGPRTFLKSLGASPLAIIFEFYFWLKTSYSLIYLPCPLYLHIVVCVDVTYFLDVFLLKTSRRPINARDNSQKRAFKQVIIRNATVILLIDYDFSTPCVVPVSTMSAPLWANKPLVTTPTI
jgi:hypothetical protein